MTNGAPADLLTPTLGPTLTTDPSASPSPSPSPSPTPNPNPNPNQARTGQAMDPNGAKAQPVGKNMPEVVSQIVLSRQLQAIWAIWPDHNLYLNHI